MPPKKSSTPKLTTFDYNPDAPELVQAASVVLAMLRYVKKHTLLDLAAAVTGDDTDTIDLLATVVLPDSVRGMLDDPGVVSVMELLRSKVTPDKREVIRTLAQCPVCESWTLCGSGGPSRCLLTRGCTGKPVRASMSKRIEIAADEISQLDEHPEPGFGDMAAHPGGLEQDETTGDGYAGEDGVGPDDGDEDPFA